ncbi:MAG TPA: bifunctional ADP-dependent NAD(P)H-hydrate dehydratase/NAD(P)H-hydrate epimerase [Blastocatellia bacterium]|nr:bifunctional ADP-dependent NAD(P)H-hydrate dehydratase/NAD(P)H-hydrate epimerase [Blastocatellia bacterium]
MREVDRLTTQNHQISSLQLMESAAAACLQAVTTHFGGDLTGRKIQILCGPGNNGGDGAALARQLSSLAVHIDVILFGKLDDTQGDARHNFQALANTSNPVAHLDFSECHDSRKWQDIVAAAPSYDVIVDALFGTGLKRPLTGVFAEVVEYLSGSRQTSATEPLIVSIDIPSGLDADQAQPVGPAVAADVTVTFTAPKVANVLPPASHLNGKLVIADIGSPRTLVDATESQLFLTEERDARDFLISTRYRPESFKNTHGHVLVLAGSRGYTGAAVLCANAAMRAGAGLVTVATPVSSQNAVAAAVMPEVMTTVLAETDRGAISDEAIDHVVGLMSKVNAVAIGPGISSTDERTRRFVHAVVAQRQTTIVIDADALNCLSPWPADLQGSEEAPLILTPHPGEMLRLLGTTDKSALADRVAVARAFAKRHKLILVLKGSRSLIAAPDGRVFINPTGNAGLGTAGAGDTLTGIIAGFVAQAAGALKDKANLLAATIAALYVGGLAGDFAARKLGMRTMVASDIREHLSDAIRSLDPKGETPNTNQ